MNLKIKAEDVQKGDRIKVHPAKREWDFVARVTHGPRFVQLHAASDTTYLQIERDAEIEVVR